MERTEKARLELCIDGTKPLPELTKMVNAACDDLATDQDGDCVIFTIDPAPAVQPTWPGEEDIHMVRRWEHAVRRLERLNTLSAVLVRGICFGPGLDILLAADLRMAMPGARLLFSAEGGLVWPGMSLHRLARQCGTARARQVMTWLPEVPAEVATAWGLVDAVVADAVDATNLIAARTAGLSSHEFAIRRQLVQEASTAEFDDALGVHLAACDRELRRLRDHR